MHWKINKTVLTGKSWNWRLNDITTPNINEWTKRLNKTQRLSHVLAWCSQPQGCPGIRVFGFQFGMWRHDGWAGAGLTGAGPLLESRESKVLTSVSFHVEAVSLQERCSLPRREGKIPDFTALPFPPTRLFLLSLGFSSSSQGTVGYQFFTPVFLWANAPGKSTGHIANVLVLLAEFLGHLHISQSDHLATGNCGPPYHSDCGDPVQDAGQMVVILCCQKNNKKVPAYVRIDSFLFPNDFELRIVIAVDLEAGRHRTLTVFSSPL